MKLSETPPDVAAARRQYVHTRWTQLIDSTISFTEEAIKYLLAVNVAAMGATLGFLGAMPHLRPLAWPRIVLMLFAAGIVLLGLYHALRYERMEWLFGSFRVDAERYLSSQLEWNALIDADAARTKKLSWLQRLLAYLSLISFYVGIAIAGYHFNDVASPERSIDERPKTKVTTPAEAPPRPEAHTGSPGTGTKAGTGNRGAAKGASP